MGRTRGVTVKVTSTVSSRVGSYPAAQKAQYSSLCTVFSEAPVSSTPPQLGQRTFHDSSNRPSRAAWRKALMTLCSLRPWRPAKANALMRQRSRSGASRTRRSMAATVSASADCRRVANKESASLMRVKVVRATGFCHPDLLRGIGRDKLTTTDGGTDDRSTLLADAERQEGDHPAGRARHALQDRAGEYRPG